MVKTTIKRITKEQQDEFLEQGRQESKKLFFTTNCKYFRYPGCECHLEHETPDFEACGFMVYKDYKI